MFDSPHPLALRRHDFPVDLPHVLQTCPNFGQVADTRGTRVQVENHVFSMIYGMNEQAVRMGQGADGRLPCGG